MVHVEFLQLVKPMVAGFGSIGLDPRFTTLCYQMLIIAMGSNFHSLYPRQPHQLLIFCTSHQFTNCMLSKCISAVLWRNPIQHAASIHLNAFNSFQSTIICGESHKIFIRSLAHSNGVHPHFTKEPLSCSVASSFFLHQISPTSIHKINKFSIGQKSFVTCHFFCFKDISFLEIFPPTLEPEKKSIDPDIAP